ncbi:hypothetical protein AMECASPLE_026045 [Ameca splendens]|uniref:Uncharacterized protein n=1 Tax=Ameca splendens TaxID=208324 RepID=A0ABV0YSJ3_9TELE
MPLVLGYNVKDTEMSVHKKLAEQIRVGKGGIRVNHERADGEEGSFRVLHNTVTTAHLREAKYMSTYNLQPYPANCQLAVTSQTSGQTHLLTQQQLATFQLKYLLLHCACVAGGQGSSAWYK